MTIEQEPLSYLALVERNNELLARLLDVFSTVSVPEQYRPPPSWAYVSHMLPCRTPSYGLQVKMEGTERGFIVSLQTVDGIPLWRHIWQWDEV